MLNGGAFYLSSTEGSVDFEDTASTFKKNFALRGGAISCNNCNLASFYSTSFEGNLASLGGALYFQFSDSTDITEANYQLN